MGEKCCVLCVCVCVFLLYHHLSKVRLVVCNISFGKTPL